MKLQLTGRQKSILDFIMEYAASSGFPPSIREIGSHFEIQPPSVLSHLKALEKKGAIRRIPFKPRCIEVIRTPKSNG